MGIFDKLKKASEQIEQIVDEEAPRPKPKPAPKKQDPKGGK